MDIINYFIFYKDLTKNRVFIIVLLAIFSSFFQTIALSMIATVAAFGDNSAAKSNRIARIMYSFMNSWNITDPKHILITLLICAAGSYFFMSLFTFFANIYSVKLQNSIYRKVQLNIIRDIFKAKFEYFNTKSIGELNNIAIGQLRQMVVCFKTFAGMMVLTISVVPFLIIPFSINPKLAFSLVIFLLPLILPLRIIYRKTKEYSLANVVENSSLYSLMIQCLTHYKYIKATNVYDRFLKKLSQITLNITSLQMKNIILSGLVNNMIVAFGVGLICCLVYWQVVMEGVPIANAGVVMGLLYMAFTRISAIPGTYHKFVKSAGAIISYKKLIRELEEYCEIPECQEKQSADFNGDLTFEKVSFKYSAAEKYALRDISLKIPQFASVAFVGGSGAGKSTIVNIITGLLPPTDGMIYLGKIPYSKIDLNSLRSRIGYVTQEPVIFSDTVANNITLWDKELDIKSMHQAAQTAHADSFISEMPNGYDTILGDNGVTISGGQRQRISIAREFYRNTEILIFDEATSALDSESEQIIQESIKKIKGKCTIVIIAHRLSTIKHCDKIYVLDEGKIIEEGSYDELLSINGLFRSMVDRQSL